MRIEENNCFFRSRSEGGYDGIGSEFIPDFSEIRKSIIEAYGTDSDVDWTIVHNAGKLALPVGSSFASLSTCLKELINLRLTDRRYLSKLCDVIRYHFLSIFCTRIRLNYHCAVFTS